MKNIPIQTGLKLADGFIEILRSELNTLTWLEYSFPAVQVGENQITKRKYPEVYIFDGLESQIIMPDIDVKSFTFFEKNNVRRDDKGNIYDLNLLCWCDLQTIGTQIDNLVSDIIDILEKYSSYDISVTYDDIFQRYGMEYSKNQWFMYPFGKFKINFKCKRLEVC
jgi:hypothetical protein